MVPIRVRVLACRLAWGFAALLAGGCVTQEPPPAEFDVPPGRYAEAFEAVQGSLRDLRFEIDRVDARAGVITTQAKSTGGFGTPWDRDQTTLDQEWEDLTDLNDRRVRVTFEPRGGAAEPPPGGQATTAPDAEDFRQSRASLVGRVIVVVDRTRRPGWRLDPTAIVLGTHSSDPDLARRGMEPSYTEPLTEDRFLAARLAKDVRKRMGTETDADAVPGGG